MHFIAFLIAVVHRLSTSTASQIQSTMKLAISRQFDVKYSYKNAKAPNSRRLGKAFVTFLLYCYFPKRLGVLFLKQELKFKLVLF